MLHEWTQKGPHNDNSASVWTFKKYQYNAKDKITGFICAAGHHFWCNGSLFWFGWVNIWVISMICLRSLLIFPSCGYPVFIYIKGTLSLFYVHAGNGIYLFKEFLKDHPPRGCEKGCTTSRDVARLLMTKLGHFASLLVRVSFFTATSL